MRETEFWRRMTRHLGADYAHVWADQTVLGELDDRTTSEALADGIPFKAVWRAVWAFLELPDAER
ncbi:DUF3046 domain-containing protein [Propionibacterium acidifaciens]|uniref:DUF3046 domain-containing protein n=1 Tax=Propionibacterium acidifaciens TaxID=556499 RepID=UPI0004912B94|nr:DUF3046 domain-containing protein [Propionibacterium acidifaciens]